MTFDTFTYIWNQGIIKAAKDAISEIDPILQKKYSIQLDDSENMCQKLYYEYDRNKNTIRNKYFDTGENNENRIDGHKICACITAALINIRLISFNIEEENIPINISCLNYTVAFMGGIYVLYLILLSDYKSINDMDHYNKLEKKATFSFPQTNEGHDSYAWGRIKTIALNDAYGNDFDILTYADMLYWIEKYNKYLLDIDEKLLEGIK